MIMDVSIIIPVLNEEKRIGNCLDSISKQDFAGSYEIIIVDNGCTDNTVNIIKRYQYTKVVTDFGHLGSARQTGLEVAKSSFIVFIDADEVADINWLSELYKFRNEYDAILGSVMTLKIVGNRINNYFTTLSQLSVNKCPAQFRSITFGSGNVLINREKALRIGFDRTLPTSEDGDFSYRFIKNNYKVLYNPNAIIRHNGTPNNIKNFIKYQNKLAYGLMLNIKKFKSLDLIKVYILSMLYPISPVFIIRVLRAEKKFDLFYLILGIMKFFIYLLNLINIFMPKNTGKIIRPK